MTQAKKYHVQKKHWKKTAVSNNHGKHLAHKSLNRALAKNQKQEEENKMYKKERDQAIENQKEHLKEVVQLTEVIEKNKIELEESHAQIIILTEQLIKLEEVKKKETEEIQIDPKDQLPEEDKIQKKRVLSVLLFLQCIVPFRSIQRIMNFFASFLGIDVPHFTSVINWVYRYGLSLYRDVGPIDEPWIAITDFTINVGIAKLLVILRVPVSIYAVANGGITLKECQCVGLKIMFTVNGETVCAALSEIFEKCGNPALFLKDRGGDLKKGVELWIAAQTAKGSENEEKKDIYVVDDISHVFANILKAEYSKLPAFIKFLSLVRKLSSTMRQTPVAFLCPPKLRTCGRFMGIYRLAQWIVKTLNLIDQWDKEARRSLLGTKINHLFVQLELLSSFLNQFVRDCRVAEDILELLKNEGINKKTYDQAIEILKELPELSAVRKKIETWLMNTLKIHTLLKLGKCSLLISSDIIESLFGKFKNLVQRGPTHELNRSILVIPAMCGRQTEESVMNGLAMISGKDLNQWVRKYIPFTQRQRRMECLSTGKLSPQFGPESVRTEPLNVEEIRLSA